MAWEGSNRRDRLPPDWELRRLKILQRDSYRCTWIENNRRCPVKIDLEVDHRIPGDDHSDANLRTLCKGHHSRKSAREGVDARAAKRKALKEKFGGTETHPGLIPPRRGAAQTSSPAPLVIGRGRAALARQRREPADLSPQVAAGP